MKKVMTVGRCFLIAALISLITAIVTKLMGITDILGLPLLPNAFLSFANTCLLVVIAIATLSIAKEE